VECHESVISDIVGLSNVSSFVRLRVM